MCCSMPAFCYVRLVTHSGLDVGQAHKDQAVRAGHAWVDAQRCDGPH